jgi:hypothetical protein
MVISEQFPLQVCFDGSNLVVKNTLDLLVQVLPLADAGPTKPPGGWTRKADTVDGLSRAAALIDPDPSILPPGYQVTIPVTSAAQVFKLYAADDENDFFWLQFLSDVYPSDAWGDYTAVSTFAQTMSDLDTSTHACLHAASNFIGDAACVATAADDATVAAETLRSGLLVANADNIGSLGGASKVTGDLVSTVLTLLATSASLYESNQQYAKFVYAPKRILFGAGPSTANCTTTSIMSGVPAYVAANPENTDIYQPVSQPTCNAGWAEQQVNNLSSTGQYESPDNVIAQIINGAWKVVAIGEGEDCAYIPTAGLVALDPSSLPCPGS